MPKRGTEDSCCKDSISEASRPKGLARAASHAASAFTSRGLINSWPKAILAAGFFTLTNYVIFEDVLRHGATITTDHLLSFAVLVGTFAAGHWFWPSITNKEWGTAAGLALLFAAGTVYCVLTSAGRNAEALSDKAAKVAETNGPYAELERKAQGAKSDMDEAKRKVGAAEADAKAATEKADAVCRKHGAENWRCETERKNEDAAEGRKSKAETAHDEKKGASILADARLSVARKKDTNGDLKYAAKVLGYFGVNVSDEMLADIVPFIKGVFCEFATLLFAAGAFRHRPETVPSVPPKPSETKIPETVPHPAGPCRDRPTATVLRLSYARTVPQAQAAALVLLRQHLGMHGTVPQSDLAGLFGDVSKQTVSRWCDDWEAKAHVARTVSGRTKSISLARSAEHSRQHRPAARTAVSKSKYGSQ